jgi:hypothetical protein
VVRLAETGFIECQVIRIERDALAGMAAEEAGYGLAGAAFALFHRPLEPLHVRFCQPV